MQINIKESTILPAVFITVWSLCVCMSLSEIEMQTLSYGVLAISLLGATFYVIVYLYQNTLSKYGLLNVLFLGFLVSVSILSGNDFKNAIYISLEIILILVLMRYYRERMKMVIICFALSLSLCIYCNVLHMSQHPELWIVEEEKAGRGYLLGGNYNGMGIRMIVALITNIACLKFSKWWLINLIPLIIACILPLFIVGSMTSLTSIIIFLLFCLLPSSRIRRMATIGMFSFFLLFQIFVVFSGNGIEHNDLAVYFIEDVLHKDITFTYRTYMWDSALSLIAKSPIWGHGYADEAWFRANMSNFAIGPHNFILSVLIYGGVVLLILYITICFKALLSIFACKDHIAEIVCFGVVTLMFMMLMEMYPYPLVFYLLALAYYYPNIVKENLYQCKSR